MSFFETRQNYIVSEPSMAVEDHNRLFDVLNKAGAKNVTATMTKDFCIASYADIKPSKVPFIESNGFNVHPNP